MKAIFQTCRRKKSLDLCKMLIDRYPESARIMSSGDGEMAVHCACGAGALDTTKYCHELYLKGMETRSTNDFYQIHCASFWATGKDQDESIRFLLKHDPTVHLGELFRVTWAATKAAFLFV